jgi:DegV family protein with EDD domain
MSVRIVADSACDVPASIAAELGITIVPVYINIGERSYREEVDISRHDFYEQLSGFPTYPTTAAPSAGTFAETYRRLTAEGASEILSVHIAANLSATYNAARLGADEAQDAAPVTLFDTGQITLGAGLLAIMAAEEAARAQSVSEIVSKLQTRVAHTHVFGMIDNLEALRRSGRVSWATFGLGTLMQIKPVMMIHQGEISVVAKIRTRKRATAKMVEMVDQYGPFERIAVIHVNALDAAEQLKKQAASLLVQGHSAITSNITPAIGTHLGLGAIGFACIAAPR